MVTMTRAKAGASSRSSMWVQGPEDLGASFASFLGMLAGAGFEVEKLG